MCYPVTSAAAPGIRISLPLPSMLQRSSTRKRAMDDFNTRVVGRRVRRIEDRSLLCGAGRYLDDIDPPNTLHAAFVRSSHAHALICSIHVDDARAMPGVVTV